MKIHASGEDYLEAVLIFQKKQGMVRSIDLARHMGCLLYTSRGQSQCNAGIQACPCYHVFRQDRGRIKCGSPDKRIGRSGQEDKHLRNRLSCAGCFFPAAMCGGFCNSYCHDDYREVGL